MAPLNEATEGQDARQDSDELGREITKLLAKVSRTVQVAGLANDPIYPLLDLTFSSLKLQWRLHNQAVRYFHDASDRLDRQYQETIKKADLAVQQAELALQAKQASIVDQLVPKIAGTVEMAVRHRVRITNMSVMAGWGIAVLLIALLPSAFAYTAGLSTGRTEGESAAHAIQAAMAAGPDAAMEWALLMANNNPVPAMADCRKAISTDAEGRRYCTMPVWLDPRSSAPQ